MGSVTSDRRRGLNASTAIKSPVIAASTGNLTLEGEQTVDGIALVTGDRAFPKDQTDASENGIYRVDTSAWPREPDWDGKGDIVEGTMVPVSRGATNALTWWIVSNTGSITIGTTDVTFTQGLTDVAISATSTVTDESSDTTCFPVFMTEATGNNALKSGTNLTFNSSTGELGFDIATIGGVATIGGTLDVTGDSTFTGTASIDDATDATSDAAASLQTDGGAGIVKTIWGGQDIVLDERADHAATSAAGMGIVWIKNDAPNVLMFTDDVATDFEISRPSELQTETVTTSGTTHDYTSIPSWVKKITIMLSGVTTSGTDAKLIQIGDAGDIEATEYLGNSCSINTAVAITAYTTGFGIRSVVNTDILTGSIVLTLEDSTNNTWIANGSFAETNTADIFLTVGAKSLTATLDRIRVTTISGSDTFTAGEINIMWE